MRLYKKFLKLIDGSEPIFCNETFAKQLEEIAENHFKPKTELIEVKKVSRCCGRCDGNNDICVSDMMCDDHGVIGCEECYGPRFS